MQNIMEQILTGKLNSFETYTSEIDKFVDEEKRTELIQILKNIKKYELYSSHIHGLFHSEKVLLFAYLIAKEMNLDPVSFQIIVDAAIYHDIKRQNDFEDPFHGMASANAIEKVVTNEIYKDEKNLEMLKAIIDIHSQDDKVAKRNFDNYELDLAEYDRYKLLFSILKDADALDRKRFVEASMAALNPKFLRFEFSKELIALAEDVNFMYYEMMGKNRKRHVIDPSKSGSCFHSISFDFFKLNSILENGILSASMMKSKNLNVPRNFEGGNSENWISVVDASLVHYKYSGYQNFTEHGIGFFCEVSEMIKPLDASRKAEALERGLPYNKSGHEDERYVYECIPVDNIVCTIIPQEYVNKNITELTYLYNSLNFDLFVERIKYYTNRFDQENIQLFDENYKEEKFEELLAKYKMTIDKFIESNHTEDNKLEVENKLTGYLEELNKFIQNAMNKYYMKLLNKTDNVSVLDVVSYEMNKSGIEYNFYYDNEEAIFMFKKYRKGEKPKTH